MSDALEHEVKIIIDVVSNFREAARKVDELSESVGGLDKRGEQAAKTLHQLADASDAAAKGTQRAVSASRGMVDILTLEERKARDTTRQWELYAKALSSAGRSRWSDQNASNARNATSARAGSVFDQGQRFDGSSAGSAADTTWARDSVRRSEAARRALADYDRQLNSNTVSYKASTGAIASNARAFDEWAANLPRQRYALYDVAFAAGATTAAVTALGAAVLVASGSFESAFTDVERTMEPGTASVEAIRGQLMQLSREIPLTFQEISQIATLGNQLGVEASAIEGFTGTVARFSAVAGVSAEETAKSFGAMGEILGVLPSQYENLGSSIALVGRRSVATEQEILSLTREIGQQAHSAGFTADQVVGLAGALGELRLPPERSRGSLTTYFQTLNKAVADGGPKLDAFARLVGVTAGELESMVRGNEGAEIMRRFLESLQDFDNVDTTKALDELGLAQLRVSDVFQRLSSNVNVFNDNLANGAQGWTEGSELARQYGMVLDDLESKWQIFLNAVMEVASATGDALAPAVKAALDAVTPLLHNLAAFAESPFGQWVIQVTAGVGALVAALAGALGTFALTRGALLAIQTALATTSWAGATAGIQGFVSGMLGMSTATGAAATALNVFKFALIGTGIGAAVVLLGSLTGAFMTAGQAAEQTFNTYIGTTAGLSEAMAADAAAHTQALADGNMALAGSFVELAPLVNASTGEIDTNAQAALNAATILGVDVPSGFDSASQAISNNSALLGQNTTEWIKNRLFQNEAFQDLTQNASISEAWVAIGADFDDAIAAQAANGEAGLRDYYFRLAQAAYENGTATLDQIALISASISEQLYMAEQGLNSSNRNFKTELGSGFAGKVSPITGGAISQMRILGLSGTKAGKDLAAGAETANAAYTDLNKTVGGSGGGTAARIRTLVDYANDLSSVFKRASDIRFGSQQGLDQVTSGWIKIKNAADAAREAVEEHQRKLADLAADQSIKQYWLMVAENYGDELRAAKLRSELADISADMTEEQKKLAKAQGKASMTLVGNSEAAIENRAEILGMVGSYQDYLKALAASGVSQSELQQKAVQLRAEFVNQAVSMGYNRQQVELYAAAFDDMATIIAKVPRNITITANADPALQALNEFVARARSTVGSGINVPVTTSFDDSGAAKAGRASVLQAQLASWQATYNRAVASGSDNQAIRALENIQRISGILNSGNYWTGGYTGDGGKYEPRGVVHGGEFVFSKAATKAIGVNNLSRMHNMAKNGNSAAPVGLGAAAGMVELSPYDRMLLQDIADRVGLTIAGQTIQATTNGANANAAQRRSA